MTVSLRFTARARGYPANDPDDQERLPLSNSAATEARNGLRRAVSLALGHVPVDTVSTNTLEAVTSQVYDATLSCGKQGIGLVLGNSCSDGTVNDVYTWIKRLQAASGKEIRMCWAEREFFETAADWNCSTRHRFSTLRLGKSALETCETRSDATRSDFDARQASQLNVEPPQDSRRFGRRKGTGSCSSSRPVNNGFRPNWLRLRCERVVENATSESGLSGADMALHVLSVLADKSATDASLQSDLFDALGGDFDAVTDVLRNRKEITDNGDAVVADCSQADELYAAGLVSEGAYVSGSDQRSQGPRNPSQINSMFTIRDSREIARAKQRRKDENLAVKVGLLQPAKSRSGDDHSESDSYVQKLGGSVMNELQKAFPGISLQDDNAIGSRDRIGLPKGASRIVGKGYEEISVPAVSSYHADSRQLIKIKAAFERHPDLAEAFSGITTLNPLQSSVFPVAYNKNENMLVCAPTGAGKTNVALLTILREIVLVRENRKVSFKAVYVAPMKALAAEVVDKFSKRLSFLGIRVKEFTGDMSLPRREAMDCHVLVTTPEKWDVVTRKSGSELGDAVSLFIIDEVHLLHDDRGAVLESIVARTLRLSESAQRVIRLIGLSATLPNYADVAQFLRVNPAKGLFHFGASHRPVPLKQTFVGVSDTGSNASAAGRAKRTAKMTSLAWNKVSDVLRRNHQAMVFVHSRKATASTARDLIELATKEQAQSLFLRAFNDNAEESRGSDSKSIPSWAAKEIARSCSRDVRELCSKGVGIHHAGLSRPDRKLVERLFANGVLKLLCCTATLAWGVNLPARAVIILGTDIYDAQKGSFVQLGMLDVMQIFGRAGRPQFDTEGEGTIITKHEFLGKYLNLLTAPVPIESTLGASSTVLADHLNAEIVSGTVCSVGDGVRWLRYTYLSVRMPKNPLVYGVNWEELELDPELRSRQAVLIEEAARALDDAQMCRYDPRVGSVAPTDLGRVASYFYVSHRTVVLWNELLSSISSDAGMSPDQRWEEMDATVLHAVSCASEFEQVRAREEELEELDHLAKHSCPIKLKAGTDTREGKVNVLLQTFISQSTARQSDLSYVAQCCTRLLRALFEVALRKGLPSLALSALELARSSELRVWPFQHPLWQFFRSAAKSGGLAVSAEILDKLHRAGQAGELYSLRDLDKGELTSLLRSPKYADVVHRAIFAVPTMEILQATVAPITRTVLAVKVRIVPSFTWRVAIHGDSESWWLWVEDQEHDRIYHSERIVLTRQRYLACCRRRHGSLASELADEESTGLSLSMTVPVFDPPSRQYWVRVESETWHTGGGSSAVLSLRKLALPQREPPNTALLNLRPLPVLSVLKSEYAALYHGRFTHFNPIQTQVFHAAYHTDQNLLIGAPTGSGKTVMAELAMLRSFDCYSDKCVVYIAPMKALVRERVDDWKERLYHFLGKSVVELTGDVGKVDARVLNRADVIVATPEKWDSVSRKWRDRAIVRNVSLIILDEVHLLGADRGPVLEVIVSRARRLSVSSQLHTSSGDERTAAVHPPKSSASVRFMALSTALANARELSDWLGVDPSAGLFSFHPSVRPVPCEVHVAGVAGERYCPRMQAMNRPAYSAILRYSPSKPVLVFVSSRRQTRLTAMDLIRLASADGNPHKFVRSASVTACRLAERVTNVLDAVLKETLALGVGIHHAGLVDSDRRLVEQLFAAGDIQVLVSTATLAWGVNLPAHLVIVKGSEYFDAKEGRYVDMPVTDLLQMIGRAGRPQFDSKAFAMLLVHEPKKTFLKKFLYEPFPVESSLHEQLVDHINAEISAKSICSPQDAIDYLTWTYLFRRVVMNPAYYGIVSEGCAGSAGAHYSSEVLPSASDISSFCSKLISSCITRLAKAGCITVELKWAQSGHCSSSNVGSSRLIDSNVSLQHPTVKREAQMDGASAADFVLAPTALGHIGTHYYLSHITVARVNRVLKADMTHEAVIDLLAKCEEFAQLPVRHNEDNMNCEFGGQIVDQLVACGVFSSKEEGSKVIDWRSSPGSSDTKVKLLLYGHLARVSPPVVDYVTDLKTSLEHAARLLQAMIDIACEKQILSSARTCVEVSQMLYQGRIASISPLDSLAGNWSRACDSLLQAIQINSVREATARAKDVVAALASGGVESAVIHSVSVALGSIPIVSASATVHSDSCSVSVEVTRKPSSVARKLETPQETGNKARSAHTTALNSRCREDGWIIFVSIPGEDSLLGMKRVGSLRESESSAKVSIKIPADTFDATRRLLITISNDAYVGIDQELFVDCERNDNRRTDALQANED